MRDVNKALFEEADLYFRDPAFEKPLFPRVSRDAIVDMEKLHPASHSTISVKLNLSGIYSSSNRRNVPLHEEIPLEHLDHEPWMSNPMDQDFDDSSFGTLDYSVDTLDDERVSKAARRLKLTQNYIPPAQPLLPKELQTMVIKADDAINQEAIDDLDVHARTREDECFGVPIGWLTTFLHNLMG